jgi:PEP-CTERM motif
MSSTMRPFSFGARPAAHRLMFAGAIACLAVCQSSRAAQVDLTTAHLSDLLVPGSYAIVGNERFDTFAFSATSSGGAMQPDPANIKVSAINPPPDTGLFFQGGPFLTVGTQTTSQFVDAHLTFDVTALNPLQPITMAELSYTAATTGGGSASILEVVRNAANQQLGQQLVIEQQNLPNGGMSFATMTFAPQTTIQVSKDILLVSNAFATDSPISVAAISDFSQVFDGPRVPEPSSVIMAAMGSAGLGWFGWRRKNRKRVRQSLQAA